MNADQRLRLTSIDRRIAFAVTHWDMSYPAHRRYVRQWRRHRFWVRWGGWFRWVSTVAVAVVLGTVLASLMLVAVGAGVLS